MKRTVNLLISILVLIVFIGPAAAAQTQGQLEQKYPKLNAYRVRSNILLTAKYAGSGRVCEMVLQPLRWSGDSILLFPLSESETVRVVEEIVPESERANGGKKLGGLAGIDKVSAYSGHSINTPYYYQNITIELLSLLEHRRKVALIWWPWSLGVTVHASDWRNIASALKMPSGRGIVGR